MTTYYHGGSPLIEDEGVVRPRADTGNPQPAATIGTATPAAPT